MRSFETPDGVTLSDFSVDRDRMCGTFVLRIGDEAWPDPIHFGYAITGWPQWQPPMFHSPLGAPASFAAVRVTPDTEAAVDDALRSVMPRLHKFRPGGAAIPADTPLAQRADDPRHVERARRALSTPGFAITVRVAREARRP